MNEKLSALMDGELGEFETRRVLAELDRDPLLRSAWERYHVVRAALRSELDPNLSAGLAERVATRLDEPAAPAGARPGRIVATLAIAASVAAITIVGIQQLQAPVPTSPVAAAPGKTATTPLTTVARETANPEPKTAAVERTLNPYLVEHNQFAPSAGVGGMLPYVRVVGYDAGQ